MIVLCPLLIMAQNNFRPMNYKKIDLLALLVTILLVGLYASPLLLHISNSFTLFPKNLPSFYANYVPGLYLKTAILKFHSFPFWIPIFEGGRPALNYPVDISLTPFAVFSVIFGEIQGMNLTWFFLFVFGAGSMFYLTRIVLKYDVFGSIFSALVFSMSGMFVYLFENGIFFSAGVLLLPLLLAFFIKAKEEFKFVILSSLILSLLLISVILFFPVIILFLFLFALVNSVEFKSRKIIIDSSFLRIFCTVCFFTALISAVKILPFLQLLSLNNRISGLSYLNAVSDANTLSLFFRRLLVPESLGPGTMYLGLLPVTLFLFACLVYLRQLRGYIIILTAFIILSFGPNSFVDLHRLLWNLPIFNSLKEISKYYSIIIVFLVALISGRIFAKFTNLKLKPLSVMLPAVIIIFTYLNLFNSNIGYFSSFNTRLNYSPVAGETFQVKGFNIHHGDESISEALFYFLAKKNVGFMNFEFYLKLKSSVAPRYYLLPKYAFLMPYSSLFVLPNPYYKGEVFFLSNNNDARLINISPNLISVKINTLNPDRLVINQNFDRDWNSNKGKIEGYNGLLSVRLNKGETGLLRLTYFPKLLFLGLLISLVSLVASFFVLFKKEA
ncbi:MAG: hypothetical protein NTZ63_05495 [Candidatus Omnitrophica bacterium]|nr:hypothetical protein [Candidatus Omnitrophota bacterium]